MRRTSKFQTLMQEPQVKWRSTGDLVAPLETVFAGETYRVRLNDPLEDSPTYVVINAQTSEVIGSFEDWPANWYRPSADEVLAAIQAPDAEL